MAVITQLNTILIYGIIKQPSPNPKCVNGRNNEKGKNMKQLKVVTLSLVSLALLSTSCKKESKDENTTPSYKIVNSGNASVTSITDTEDKTTLNVVQAVPSVEENAYPCTMPIMLFLDDKVLLSTIIDNVTVEQDGQIVGGTISVNEAANGFAIITFTPSKEFASGKEITITIKKELTDDGGNGFEEDYVLTYLTKSASTGSFDNNASFENGKVGVSFVGDGAILESQGDIIPNFGSKYAAITTGNALISDSSAVGGSSSMMILGPISKSMKKLTFNYDFVSTEFNEYVGSVYDDCAMVTITGPNGTISKFITSVNTIESNNTACVGFAKLPDTGDEYAGHIGWQTMSFDITEVGTPAYITFTVTDVKDGIYSSALVVDNITY